jgi:hypothetical protein
MVDANPSLARASTRSSVSVKELSWRMPAPGKVAIPPSRHRQIPHDEVDGPLHLQHATLPLHVQPRGGGPCADDESRSGRAGHTRRSYGHRS